jgi:glycosyltransferase involved in cell wall biosynthesis
MLTKLTIAIPTYRRNDYLIRLLNTIPSNLGVKVVVSDNECHVTNDIKQEFDKFIFIGSEQKLGMFQNWNIALENVDTEWFILPSDDDMFCTGSFDKIDSVLKQNPQGDVFIFGHNIIDENDNVISSWIPEKFKLFVNFDGFKVFMKGVDARCPSIILRTELARKMGAFDESLDFTAADSLLIQKCLLYGESIFVPEIISSYRVWPNNFTNQLIATKEWMDKIELWTDKLIFILSKDFSMFFTKTKIKNIKDEIFAQNLLVGISKIRKKGGFFDALKFIIKNRYPYRADFKTQLVIIKTLLLGWV